MPIVVMLWSVIILLMWFQYHRESEFRESLVKKQLALFNTRILDAYANKIDIEEMMQSLSHFFADSRFADVRVSVYADNDFENGLPPLYAIGEPIDREFGRSQSKANDVVEGVRNETHNDSQTTFFYKVSRSNDGKLSVYTAMPATVTLMDSLRAADPSFWILVCVLFVVAAVVTWLTTNPLTRNVRLLKEFAAKAVSGIARVDIDAFPHNELGDISREIVKLYRARGKALERSRREHDIAIHAIEEKSLMKRQLTNNINHELKTPVGVIKGYLDTVLSSDDMDRKTLMYFLKRAQENVDRLCNLLNDVSTMTRLEEGSGNIPMEILDFHDLVFSIENDFSTSGLFKNMSFEFDIPFDCQIVGNNSLLTSAMSNLIKNAMLHSHGTAMGIRVVSESEKYYTFAFWDNGTGVDDMHLPHLFDRFYRVDSGRSRKSGGTGLGLPIVKDIIDNMGGTISVHNRSTGGLEFMFTLRKA